MFYQKKAADLHAKNNPAVKTVIGTVFENLTGDNRVPGLRQVRKPGKGKNLAGKNGLGNSTRSKPGNLGPFKGENPKGKEAGAKRKLAGGGSRGKTRGYPGRKGGGKICGPRKPGKWG